MGRCLFLVLVAMVGLGDIAFADQTSKERAEKLFDDGRRYLGQKEYALACTAFEQSHVSDPAIGTQLNIALCYESWGKTASAYRAYREAEKLAYSKNDPRAAGARKKVDELAPKIPRLTFTIPDDADPSTVFLFDGKEIDPTKLKDELFVDAGKHTVDARVPGKPGKLTEVDIQDGQRLNISIVVPKPEVVTIVRTAPRSKPRFYGGIAAIGSGTVLVGLSAFVALAARQDYRAANCPDHMCATQGDLDRSDDARTRARNMTYVGVGGLAIAGVGVYLLLTSRRAQETTADNQAEQASLELRPLLGRDSIGLAIGGSL
jgi:tetratricopeptide (TPR) repeat protein